MTASQENGVYDKERDLLSRILVLQYLAGDYFVEGKNARASILGVYMSKTFEGFIKTTFDARFFGLMSSEVESALKRGFEDGYIDQAYHARWGQPIHLMRRLTGSGRKVAKKLLENKDELHRMGISEKVEELAVEMLSTSLLPAKFSVAFSLYLTHVASDICRPVEGHMAPTKIIPRLSLDSIQNLLNNYFDGGKGKLGLVTGPIEIQSDDYVRFHFMIEPDFIKKRYSYIVLTESDISSLSRLVDQSSAHELPFVLANQDLDEADAKPRAQSVTRIVKEYDLEEPLKKAIVAKLELLTENLRQVHEKGYNYILGVLEKIAESSKENFGNPDGRLEAEFVLSGLSTIYQVRIPAAIKSSIRPLLPNHVWHFGMDMHVEHIPQFLELAFLLDSGEKDYVDASAVWVQH